MKETAEGLLDTSHSDETLDSWVLSSGPVCDPSSATRECQWLVDPLERGGLSNSACFLEVDVLGAAVWGHVALAFS